MHPAQRVRQQLWDSSLGGIVHAVLLRCTSSLAQASHLGHAVPNQPWYRKQSRESVAWYVRFRLSSNAVTCFGQECAVLAKTS